ncbi:hypothetical protein B0H14DRAFT_2595594 [Mycena olivaceomarginata]|nr:hypothetical protein B0H14DRAFT_2595594 [Mycena olivaceomarginata]
MGLSIVSGFLLALSLSQCISAQDNHEWIAPTATDVRSPCPGLNTLANHGYLHRSGKNISIPDMLQAALDGFNVGPDTIIQAAKFGLLSGDDPTTLNLDALQLHNLVEHDASISRNDFAIGDNLHFNETVFSTLANANAGVDFYNATSAGQVMHDRLADSLARNPTTTNTRKEFELRIRESALYLSILGDPVTGVAPKKCVFEIRIPWRWRGPGETGAGCKEKGPKGPPPPPPNNAARPRADWESCPFWKGGARHCGDADRALRWVQRRKRVERLGHFQQWRVGSLVGKPRLYSEVAQPRDDDGINTTGDRLRAESCLRQVGIETVAMGIRVSGGLSFPGRGPGSLLARAREVAKARCGGELRIRNGDDLVRKRRCRRWGAR